MGKMFLLLHCQGWSVEPFLQLEVLREVEIWLFLWFKGIWQAVCWKARWLCNRREGLGKCDNDSHWSNRALLCYITSWHLCPFHLCVHTHTRACMRACTCILMKWRSTNNARCLSPAVTPSKFLEQLLILHMTLGTERSITLTSHL